MRRGCCSPPQEICIPCCLPAHDLQIEVTLELTAMFEPVPPPPWIFTFTLPLVYTPISGQPRYIARVPPEYVWFNYYAVGIPFDTDPGSWDPSSGTPYPPSEGFTLWCLGLIYISVLKTTGPFSIPGGGGYWGQPTAYTAFSTNEIANHACDAYVTEWSCDPIDITWVTRNPSLGCAWGQSSFGATEIIRSFRVTDPNYGSDGDCTTPASAVVHIPIKGCASDLSGIDFTLTYDSSSIAGTSDENSRVAFTVPWWPNIFTWSADPATLPFRLSVNPANTSLSINPNITDPPTTDLASVINLSYNTTLYNCIQHPGGPIPIKKTLYLTDSVLGSTTLTNIGSGVYSWTTTLTALSYARSSDGVVCPSALVDVMYRFDVSTGLLWIWLWTDASYCPHVTSGAAHIAQASVACTLDSSMLGSDVVIFRASRDWSIPGGDQTAVKDIHRYVYGFAPATYLISE